MLVRSFRALLAFGIATCSAILTAQTLSGTTPLQYTALQIPCRAVDTRVTGGPIAAGTSQSFYPAGGVCNIPLPTSGVGLLAGCVHRCCNRPHTERGDGLVAPTNDQVDQEQDSIVEAKSRPLHKR
jgi:hypothetical protein